MQNIDPAIEEKEMARDAARYRFLRSKDVGTINRGGVFAGQTPSNIVLNGDDLDAAVDAEMEQLGKLIFDDLKQIARTVYVPGMDEAGGGVYPAAAMQAIFENSK